MKETFKKAAVAFSLQIFGASLSFFFSFVMARMLGAEDVGIYLEVFNLAFLAALAGRIGLDNVILRFGAASVEAGNYQEAAGLYRKSRQIIGWGAGLLSLGLFLLAPWIAGTLFSKPEMALPLRLMALSVLPFALLVLYTQMLRSINEVRSSVFLINVSPTIGSLILLFILAPAYAVNGAVIAYTGGMVLSLIAGVWLWRKAAPHIRQLDGSYDTRRILSTSLPMFWIALMSLLMNRADILIMSSMVDSASIGIYGTAKRTALLMALLLTAVNSAVAPRFAALYSQQDIESLSRLARLTSALLALGALPVLLAFLLFAEPVMAIFGSEFTAGAPILSIIAIGQYLNVATGSVGFLLMMTGYEKLLRNILLLSMLINLLLLYVLIPPYGVIGAAVASMIGTGLLNVFSAIAVYRKLSINLIPLPDRLLMRWNSPH